jgi:hypothetical protein
MCAAVQRSDTCAAADGRPSDLLLLAVQHSAAALVTEWTWLAGSECCSQLCQLCVRADAPGALCQQRQGGRGRTGTSPVRRSGAAQRLQRCSSTVRSACVSRPGGGGEDGGVQAGCGRRAGGYRRPGSGWPLGWSEVTVERCCQRIEEAAWSRMRWV